MIKIRNTQTFLSSRQQRFVSNWLIAHRLKHGALLYWAALLTASTAVIHCIGMLKQPPQSALLAVLLLVGVIVQLTIAAMVLAIPTRRLLSTAAIVEAAAVLLWILGRLIGIPVWSLSGLTLWQPETLGLQDFFLPFIEGVTAVFFLTLAMRTWKTTSRAWRIVAGALPILLLVGCLLAFGIVFAVNAYAAELVFATFFFAAGLPSSIFYLFLPAVGLIVVVLFLRALLPRLRTMTPGAIRAALILLPVCLLASLLIWEGSSTAAIRGWFPVSATIHAPAGQTTTLAYCNIGGSPLAMDLSEPAPGSSRPAPVVFYVHGGAGFQNSRDLPTDYDSAYFTQVRDTLLKHGFAVGSIDYRLIPLASGHEIVEDAKCAVRFLRAHANELGIDAQHIGVYGDSEGGYISAMLGTTGLQAGFDAGQYLDQSSQVQSVIDLWGFTDLTDFSGSPGWVHPFGEGEPIAQQRANSPITYVAPGDPPFLIIHGTDDGLIAPHHSQKLATLLHTAGVPEQLVWVQHGGHGFNAPTTGTTQQPDPTMLASMISDYFIKTLA